MANFNFYSFWKLILFSTEMFVEPNDFYWNGSERKPVTNMTEIRVPLLSPSASFRTILLLLPVRTDPDSPQVASTPAWLVSSCADNACLGRRVARIIFAEDRRLTLSLPNETGLVRKLLINFSSVNFAHNSSKATVALKGCKSINNSSNFN